MLPEEDHSMEFQGIGWNWQADAVARCLRGRFCEQWSSFDSRSDGLLECPLMPHSETTMSMEVSNATDPADHRYLTKSERMEGTSFFRDWRKFPSSNVKGCIVKQVVLSYTLRRS